MTCVIRLPLTPEFLAALKFIGWVDNPKFANEPGVIMLSLFLTETEFAVPRECLTDAASALELWAGKSGVMVEVFRADPHEGMEPYIDAMLCLQSGFTRLAVLLRQMELPKPHRN